MVKNSKKHSKFPPVFIASTVVFFLGSAYKFIFGKEKEALAQDLQATQHAEMGNPQDEQALEEEIEQEGPPQEPEEDPVQSL